MRISARLFAVCALYCCAAQSLNASSVNWSIATTSFPQDQSLGDTGHEKTPFGYVDLPTGNVVFDIPEVSLKGHRGLDFTLSRSYGKVNNGFRSMGNWELESPRLVMMTGPSTKLQGDTLDGGICENNGDVSNSGNATSGFQYGTSLTSAAFEDKTTWDKITYSYVYQANEEVSKRVLLSIYAIANSFPSLASQLDQNASYNKDQAAQAFNALNQQIFNEFQSYTQNMSFNSQDMTQNKANALQSLRNVMNGGTVLNITQDGMYGGRNTVRLSVNNVESYLNQDFVPLNSVITASPNSSGILAQFVQNTAYIYLYSDMLLRTKVYTFTDVRLVPSTSKEPNFPLSTRVDTRLRPISLYLPAQKNRTFYPIQGSATALGYPSNAKYISQDNWYISCGVGAGKGFTVRASNGTRYLFPETNRENQTGYPTLFSGQSVPGRVSVYASKVENQFGESYALEYLNQTSSSLVYSGYNYTNKLLLKKVQHQLDGSNTSSNSNLLLTYVKNDGTATEIAEADFATKAGDVVLKNIQRMVNGAYVAWASYEYGGAEAASTSYKMADLLPSGETVGDFQQKNQASLYLKAAGYRNGDSIGYQYGGPYRILGNAMPLANGLTKQSFIWYYSDLTGASYYKGKKAANTAAVLAQQVIWNYQLNTFARAGYAESKAYRVNKSTSTGSSLPTYEVQYSYTARDAALNTQSTTVISKDTARSEQKSLTYVYSAYEKGLADNYRHGLLKTVTQGDRTEQYDWITVGTAFGKTPVTTANNYTDYQNIPMVRMSKRSVTHHGSYSTELSNFDLYGNAKTRKENGLNGATAVSRTATLAYFNADPASATVSTGAHPWLVGLSQKVNYGTTLTLFTTSYDAFGAVKSDVRAGKTTQYAYESASFMVCVRKLTSFEWTGFLACTSDYIAGELHTGLLYKQDVGNGDLVTYYSQYQYGQPTQIQRPNGTAETQQINDFGQVIRATDADGVVSVRVYDNTGRLEQDHPVFGLAYTEYSYDGLTQTMTAKNSSGVELITDQTLDGEGRVISTKQKSGTKSIFTKQTYDAFGRTRFQSYPALTASGTAGTTSTYDEFDRLATIDESGALTTLCYQSCAGSTGALSTATDAYGTTTQRFYALGDFDSSLVSDSERKGSDQSITASSVVYDAASLQPKTSSKGNSQQTYTYYSSGLLKTQFDNSSSTSADLATYTYDAVGRTKTITHPDGTVETLAYVHKLGGLPSSRVWNGQTSSYTYSNAGRSKTVSGLGVTLTYGLDSYGRTKTLTQQVKEGTTTNSYVVTYTYNNLGQVTGLKYPSGKTVSLASQNGFGEVSTIPNVIQSIGYNQWHQPTTITANADVAWTMGYEVDGRPASLTHQAIGQCQLGLAYGYDDIKRIRSITDQCGKDQYNATFDRYGSGQLKKASMSHGNYDYTYLGDDILTVKSTRKQTGGLAANYTYNYVSSTSKLDSITGSGYSKFEYDRMNRVTNDGIRTLSYDAYGRVKQAGADTYLYAPENLRVRANRQGYGLTDYVYGLAGELLYEIDLTTQLAKNYVYASGQLVASLESYPNTDSDGDGVLNLEELEYGTNPNRADSHIDTDEDGIPDYLERYLGLNPNLADSDGDGFRDGYEYNTLGLQAALSASIKPTQPEPVDNKTWLTPILNLLLSDAA